ncbi:cadherin-like protein 26 [Pygocentrus nattereri]|uniref:cadherin-like protein 26 n=1 Tax=Pygocentrus nattereri TaxID=42514 RepID=UPI0008146ED8|nr:cadherin-like protein 26 [Pygocentrus nattereri]
MRVTFHLLFLLSLWTETTQSDLRNLDRNLTEEHERVLIRTKRRWVLSTIELQEEDPGPYPKEATQLFNDKSSMHKLRFSISGQGVNEDPKGVFTIEPFTGAVIVHKPIDRELYPVFLVEFDVADRESGSILDRTLSFSVAIKDINDNAPEFLPEVLHTSIPENTQEGVLPVSLQAKDKDEKGNENSRITMRVVSQDPPSPVITLKPLSARGSDDNVITQLIFTGCFDYDKAKAYKLLVEAQDHGNPVLTSTATVNIDIIDSNTHQPVFTATKYNAQVMEMETNKEILRLSVEDKDTPNTQASKAVYKILKGNEDGNYKIETDPKTNEGVLTVIKGKDYERTTLTQLEISVENEEPLFLCIDGKPASPAMRAARKLNTTKVDVKVIDVNDPPVFQQKIQTVYKKEEGNPGEVLYEPIVKDVDSDADKIRYELVDDPAKWVKVDPKTGKVTTVMKMDRESPYVVNGTYTVVIRAIDNGEPPATGTGTLVIQLGDLNDNAPYLTSNNSIMCGNKTQRVTVKPDDADAPPFAGPFSFSIASEDKKLLSMWKFNPSTGSESSLISLKSLPYGNYLIPLRIEDQQGKVGLDTLNVVVCDCGDKDVCRSPLPRSSNLNGAAIGILLGSLLLLALLLCCCFLCEYKAKEFILNIQEEGNQTLINYNEEGGGSLAKAEIQVVQSSTNGLKSGPIQLTEFSNGYGGNGYNESTKRRTMSSGGFQETTEAGRTLMSRGWVTSRSFTFRNGANRFSRSFSLMSDWNIEDHLLRKLYELPEDQLDFPECHPHEYSYEGMGSTCPSLDELSFSADGDDLDFLNDLGPKFHILDGICRKTMEEKNIKL